ncbi:hypothetical protein E8E95_00505 [Pseudomonas sp. BN414]|uniref:hypothetical protein n=1 Tax=Pseudomonas sp. BN414 TaxID=2567888 RepID=UPI00245438FC|nr:hypothetical protein [Pseudomonas sp. BN414]MDH4565165.1 hypothetical protein [Pseudomonas sp. BN414]
MSVINRIEVSNFLNLENRRPSEAEWKPNWRHVVINLRGLSCAVVATNGLGKSTINKAIYALLSRDRKCVADTRDRAAPKRRGLWSHVRLEVLYQDTTDILQPGLLGSEVRGEAYVLGLYGFSDDELRFYLYRGHLEDCPVALIDGHRKQMVPNSEFQATLKERAGLAQGLSIPDWKRQVHRHFDPSLIHQLLLYQKAGGGDGAENFFKVKRDSGEDYDSAFFYAHIAPEVLVNCMDVYGEDGEYRFEDTLLASARPVLMAQRKFEDHLKAVQAAQKVFNGLSAANEKADRYLTTQADINRIVGQTIAEIDFLRDIVEQQPLPGIPRPMRDQGQHTTLIANQMVCQSGEWLVPDRVIAQILGCEAKEINRDAQQRGIKSTKLIPGQVLEKPTRLGALERAQGGGTANSGYALEAALALTDRRTRFAEQWNTDDASLALHCAFEWHENAGDPNPSRVASRRLARELESLRERIRSNTQLRQSKQSEHTDLVNRLEGIEAAEYVLSAMRQSTLFTDEELAAPAATGATAEKQAECAENDCLQHRVRQTALNEFRTAYQQACAEFPALTPTAAQQELSDALEAAATDETHAQNELVAAEEAAAQAQTEAQDADNAVLTLERLGVEIASLVPKVRDFEAVFPGEPLDGLQNQVQAELTQAQERHAALQSARQQLGSRCRELEDLLPSAALYRDKFGEASPGQLEATVTRELAEKQEEERRLKQDLAATCEGLAILRSHQTALKTVHQRFGLSINVTTLERELADQVAIQTREKTQVEGTIKQLTPFCEALDAFEARFGRDRDALAIAAARSLRLPECGRERDELSTQLSELRQQREELEGARATAGRLARQVHTQVGASHPRVHEVIDALQLPTQRRSLLLTHFSHVLHLPVLADLQMAQEALEALDRAGIEAPLFLRPELEGFCREGELGSQNQLAYSFLVGVVTLQVQALIDPEKFLELKASLAAKLEALLPKVDQLEREYNDLVPESATSELVRLACDAVQQQARSALWGAQVQLTAIEEQLRILKEHRSDAVMSFIRQAVAFLEAGGVHELERQSCIETDLSAQLTKVLEQLPRLEDRASRPSLDLIQAMIRFQDRGGEEGYAELTQQMAATDEALAQIAAELPRLLQRFKCQPLIQAAEDFEKLGGWAIANSIAQEIDAARSTKQRSAIAAGEAKQSQIAATAANSEARERHHTAQLQSANWHPVLVRATRFLSEDGPRFDATYEPRLKELLAQEQRARARTKFDFSLAQQAADAERDPSERTKLLKQRDVLRQELDRLERTIQDDSQFLHHEQQRVGPLNAAASAIDHAVIEILKQWRVVQELSLALPPASISTASPPSQHLRAAMALLDELRDRSDANGSEGLSELLGDLASNVDEFPLKSNQSQLKSLGDTMARDFNDLVRELDRIRKEHDGQLTRAEEDDLVAGGDQSAVVIKVKKLHRHFEHYLLQAEDLQKRSETDLQKARERLVESISGFTDSLEDNFKLLKTALGRRDSEGAAGLRIAGELIDRHAVRNEIDAVIKVIDLQQRRRDEDKAAGKIKGSDAEFEEQLKQEVRSTFYRTVFRAPPDSNASGPTVTFQHPEIAGGRPVRLTPSLSTGQGNALALLIMTKLADFALHRDALADAGSLDSRRRIKPSATRVVMIDGLFSNLSDKRMIRHSLSVIRTLKGSFQLIGWIHNELYENDPNLFPSYCALRRAGGAWGFVLVAEESDAHQGAPYEEGEVKAVEFHADRLLGNADGQRKEG